MLTCVFSALVLAVSRFSYFVVRDVSSIGSSHAIAGGPSISAQNILLMGLESRRDWNGNILPNNILSALHAGSAHGVGGNDTNTLILLHIPAGGKKAVGFSIPRDDWVNFAGTVGSGYQHLDGAQALAFVRQRDGLPNGDLDRTHRQQAFLDAVMQQLRTEGVIGDLTKIQALLSVAKQYVITDSDWNLLDFASQMQSLTSGNLVFHTLPIQRYATIDGQDANVVNPAAIKNIVQSTFYPKPAAPAAPRTQPQPGTPAAASASVAANHVEVVLGAGTTAAPTVSAAPASGSTASSSPSSSPSPIIPTSGPQGGAVGDQKGIPCVD